jgi:branched-chain amino acid transport system ATP-binding protein
MVILATEGLTKNFGGLRATDTLSLAIEEGKLTSVIGPNGAGKTTLFNLITGMIRPDAGKVLFRGEDITHLPICQIVRRGISRSFQIINLFNELPLYENVWLGVQAQQRHGPEVLTSADALSTVKEETDRIIGEIGLAGKVDTPVKLLSYGDRRILEITVALTAKPSLLLLDEPMSGLMSEDRKRIAAFMKQLASRLTLLVVEHAMDVVLSISDHIVVMHQGRLLAEGTPDEIRANDKVQEAYLGGQHALT